MGRKITFYPGGTAAPVELGEDAVGDFITGGRPSQTRAFDAFHPTRGEFEIGFNRGGKVNTLEWFVDRNHASEAAAIEFMRRHCDDVAFPLGEAEGVLADIGADGSARYLQGASIIEVECTEWVGRSTVFRYLARGGAWTLDQNQI